MKASVEFARREGRFDLAEFRAPSAKYGPAYTWTWNAPLTRSGIERQIDDMLRADIRSMYILPEPREFRPNQMRTELEPDYLSDEYIALARHALSYAIERGMCVWLYDEGGWPSGGACGKVLAAHPELRDKRINARTLSVAPDDAYAPSADACACFEVSAQGYRRILPGQPFGCACPIEYYRELNTSAIAVDVLDDELGRRFIESTHDRYAAGFGELMDSIPLMFTDEPGAGAHPWPTGFADKFAARYDYDVRDHLPALFDARFDSPRAQQLRIDYALLAEELFLNNYFRPIHEWCRAHDLLATGHLDQDHITDGCLRHNYGSLLPILREFDVPGVDAIWRQIAPPTDGTARACAEGNGFFPRFAASAASQTGGNAVLSESFAIYGAGLTQDDMRYAVGWQAARGVNLFNFMSISYGKDGALPIVARPDFTPEMPGYAHLSAINEYTARLSYLMRLGKRACDVALYFPALDLFAGGEDARRAKDSFERLGRELEDAHIDFDIIDDSGLRAARLCGGRLQLGAADYSSIVIPECRHMPPDVREIARACAAPAAPLISVESTALRLAVRRTDDGYIYLLFNEANRHVTGCVDFGSAQLCELVCETGEAVPAASGAYDFWPGQSRVFMTLCAASGSKPPAEARTIVRTLDQFTVAVVRKAQLSERGIRARSLSPEYSARPLGRWDWLDESFSGEVSYRTNVELGLPAARLARLTLEIGDLECSAAVRIAGRAAGMIAFRPYSLELPLELVPDDGRFELELVVANTLANQCVAHDPQDLFSADCLGFYNERTIPFERTAPRGGLYGPVRLVATLKPD